jgi:quercetin dioxygenase-like cupin family protein
MKYSSKEYIETGEMEWEEVAPGMKRQFMGYDDEIMMVKVKFDKGGIGQRHSHIHSQTTYVVSGSFEVSIGEDKKIIKEGDGFYIPPNVEHGAVCLEEGILIDVFSPIREDFMNGNANYTK